MGSDCDCATSISFSFSRGEKQVLLVSLGTHTGMRGLIPYCHRSHPYVLFGILMYAKDVVSSSTGGLAQSFWFLRSVLWIWLLASANIHH